LKCPFFDPDFIPSHRNNFDGSLESDYEMKNITKSKDEGLIEASDDFILNSFSL